MIKRLIVCILASGFSLGCLCFPAYSEDINITSYYPSPTGSYQDLRTDKMGVGSTYRNSPLDDGVLIVSTRVGVKTPGPTCTLDVRGDEVNNTPTASLQSSNGYGVAVGGVLYGGAQQLFGSIESFGAAGTPLLINAIADGFVRIGQADINDPPDYQLEVQGTGTFGGKFNGTNTGQVWLIWCPGGTACSVAGYYAKSVYQ